MLPRLVWLTGTNCVASGEEKDAYRPASSWHMTLLACIAFGHLQFILQPQHLLAHFSLLLSVTFDVVRARRGSCIIGSACSLSSRNCHHSEFWVTCPTDRGATGPTCLYTTSYLSFLFIYIYIYIYTHTHTHTHTHTGCFTTCGHYCSK